MSQRVPLCLLPSCHLNSCLLCGIVIPMMDETMECPRRGSFYTEERDQALRNGPLKEYWKSKPKHVIVPSTEVEESYFSKYPQLWSYFYRAIIKESDTKYRLTGINRMERIGQDDRIYSLNDPAMARIGGEKYARHYSRQFTPFDAADITGQHLPNGKKSIGYVIHAHCWVLFGRVLGLTPTDITLAKFVQASWKHWHNNQWGLHDLNADWPPHHIPSAFIYGCDIYQNPVIVPALQKAIESARFMCQCSCPCPSKVPLDVAILIAEIVCPIEYTMENVIDTQNMVFAFQWKLPGWFWRARVNADEFIEFGGLKMFKSPVDWQMLSLDLMALVSDSPRYPSSGLANRKRVLGIMLAIKSAYLD